MKRVIRGAVRRAARHPLIGGRTVSIAQFIIAASRGGHDPMGNGEYELIKRVLTRRRGERPTVVFDVGANIGDWTALVLVASTSEIVTHLFEPTPGSHAQLESRFGRDRRVRLNRVALSDCTGSATLRSYGETSAVNSLVNFPYWSTDSVPVSVDTITGDAYCAAEGVDAIDFLKIDVEGFEWHVLAGFEKMLRERRIGVIQFEYGYSTAKCGRVMRDFFALLEGYGYVMGPVRPRGPEFRTRQDADDNFDSGPNYVAALPRIAATL